MTERLAVWTSHRPGLTLAGWGLTLAAAMAVTAAFLGDALSGDEELTSNTESRRADRLLDQRLAAGSPDATEVVVRSTAATVDQPVFERRVRTLARELEQAGAVQVATSYDARDRRLVSRDERASGMLVALGGRCRGGHRGGRRRGARRRRPGRVRDGDHGRIHAGQRLLDAGGEDLRAYEPLSNSTQ